ncbi:MAG: PD-(D/E)XK nuclease family protein, partial [Candidatus Omnitrophica bacterium]|nr:PD-(D/E)XK nuclease family protein [Candidatus Omnitrophota bacterium]
SILKSNRWAWWEVTKTRSGLIASASDWLAEIRSSGLAGPVVKQRLLKSAENSRRKRKYQDLYKLLDLYEQQIFEDGLLDVEELMMNFIQESDEREVRRDIDLLVVDGFYRFTGIQKQFLQAIACHSNQTLITLTLEPGSENQAFYLPEQTRRFFLDAGFTEKSAEFTASYRFNSAGLREFETYLSGRKPVGRVPDGVRFLEVENIAEEADLVSSMILEHVKKQGSYFSDHMVIVRNTAVYRHLIENFFIRKGIPFIIHERKKLMDDPGIRLVKEWHALLTQESGEWYLNTRLFEQFCSRLDFIDPDLFKFIGNALLDTSEQESAETVIRIFEAVDSEKFQSLLESFRARMICANGGDFTRLITTELRQLFEDGNRSFFSGPSVEMFYHQFAGENAVRIQRSGMTCEEALSRLMADLESGLYSEKPSQRNQVQVYDVVLSLPKEYRNVYVMGLSDGIFPPENSENVIFDDRDRDLVFPQHEILNSKDYLSGEQYFFYMACTRASDSLMLTRPRMNDSDKELIPSVFYEQVCETACPVTGGRIPDGDALLCSLSEAIYAQDTENALRIMGLLKSMGDAWVRRAGELLVKLRGSGFADIAGTDAAARMKDPERSFSPTELSVLNDCAYKHYAEYILYLRSEESNHYLEEGNFLHECMEQWIQQKCYLRAEEQAVSDMERIFNERIPDLKISFKSHFEKNESRLRLRNWLVSTAESEHRKIKSRGDYEPFGAEMAFGKKSGNNVTLSLKDMNVRLHGKIDRIDISRSGKKSVVIDYKRGKVPSRAELVKGRNPQTPVYLLAGSQIAGYPAA